MSEILNNAQKILNSQTARQELTNAEIYIEKKTVTNVRMERGQVRIGQQQQTWGGAIRALVKKGIGFATFTAPTDGMKAMETAIASAKVAPQNPHATIPEPKAVSQIKGTFDKRILNLPQEAFQEKIIAMKNILDEKKPHGSLAQVQTMVHEVAVANLNGIAASSKSTKIQMEIEVDLKKDGLISVGIDEAISPTLPLTKTPEEVVEEAWILARKQLTPAKVGRETLPVILHPLAVREIFGWPFPPEVLGSNVVKGASPFIDKVGEVIATTSLTVVDEGLAPESFYPFPFDDEGVPKQNTTVIKNGVLKSFLYDSKSALEAETDSTGNCGRFARYDGRSYLYMPTSATHNLKIQPGKSTVKELMDVKRGIYFFYPIGAHSANESSGEFNVLPYIAFLIEDGELVGGLKKFILTSTIPKILKQIDLIGNDLTYTSIEWNHQMSSPHIRLRDADIIV